MRMRTNDVAKLWDIKTEDRGDCRIWLGGVSHRSSRHRYGNVSVNARIYQAHRLFYEHFVGPIPEGHHLHHVCCNTLCVRPEHLTPVTPRQHVNAEPKHQKHVTHCPRGHEYTPTNTKIGRRRQQNGTMFNARVCRTCHSADDARRRRNRTAEWRIERQCIRCNGIYIPRINKQRFCSQTCQYPTTISAG